MVNGYEYPLVGVMRVVDGDTVDLTVNLGFGTHHNGRFRIVTVDTPERGQVGYAEAAQFTYAWLLVAGDPRRLRVASYKADSFGRWLADIYDPLTGESLSSALLRSGNAIPYTR